MSQLINLKSKKTLIQIQINMKIKSPQWIEFKKTIIICIKSFERESTKFEFPIYDEEDFTMLVEDCEVFPVFTKKDG